MELGQTSGQRWPQEWLKWLAMKVAMGVASEAATGVASRVTTGVDAEVRHRGASGSSHRGASGLAIGEFLELWSQE